MIIRELMAVMLALHVVGVVSWIGGLSFACVELASGVRLARTFGRLLLWQRAFARLLHWSWGGMVLVAATGLLMVSLEFGGSAVLPVYVRAMMVSAIVTMAAFAWLYFMPWRLLNKAIRSSDLMTAEKRLGQVRLLVVVTTLLGLATAMIGAGGPYLG